MEYGLSPYPAHFDQEISPEGQTVRRNKTKGRGEAGANAGGFNRLQQSDRHVTRTDPCWSSVHRCVQLTPHTRALTHTITGPVQTRLQKAFPQRRPGRCHTRRLDGTVEFLAALTPFSSPLPVSPEHAGERC